MSKNEKRFAEDSAALAVAWLLVRSGRTPEEALKIVETVRRTR